MLNTAFSPWPSFTEEEAAAVSQTLLSNKVNYWTGQECRVFEKEFASYNPIFADKISTTEGRIDLIKDGKITKTYDEGIFLGVGAGDITYQLRF